MKKSEKPLVVFTIERHEKDLPDSASLIYVPSSNSWNDHGFHVRANVGIKSSNSDFKWVNGFLAFQNEQSNSKVIYELLSESKRSFITPSELNIPYATLLLNTKDYLNLVRILGTDKAAMAAAEAHDLAYFYGQGSDVPKWSDIQSSDVFNRAFMRNSESVFAFRNAAKVIAGLRLDKEDARTDFSASVSIEDKKLDYDFSFPDGPIGPNRLAILIGRNGTGKTESLLAIGRGLLNQEKRSASLNPVPGFNQLLVFAHSRSLKRFKSRSKDPTIFAQSTFGLDPVNSASNNPRLTEMVTNIARGSDFLDNPIDRLIDVITKEIPNLRIFVPLLEDANNWDIHHDDNKYLALTKFTKSGKEQDILDRPGQIDSNRPLLFLDNFNLKQNLSLGQDVFISFTIQAISESAPASIFLIDEPENFLHPNLISQFIRLLHAILNQTKSIAIVSTHSPYVVREVTRSQVFVIHTEADGETRVSQPRLKTFGASISAISDDIFGDDLIDHLYVQLLSQQEFKEFQLDQVLEGLGNELSIDALMQLREMIENGQKD